MSHATQMRRRWYYEPYVWMLISFPATAVIAGFITLYLAIASDDGLVVDDYYKRGLEINQLIEREQTAIDAQLEMVVDLNPEQETIMVTFTARRNFNFPDHLNAVLAHATRHGLDHAFVLRRVGDSSYRADGIAVSNGNWYLDVGTGDWRQAKRLWVH